MRDYKRAFRPATGHGTHLELPKVMKTFRLNVPDDWKEIRQVDSEGWLDLPSGYQADPKNGLLISIKIKSSRGVRLRLLDKESFDRLVEQVNSKDFLIKEMGLEDKGEFFCAVGSVDYDPSGKVRLTPSQLVILETEKEVELRAVKGALEIGPPS